MQNTWLGEYAAQRWKADASVVTFSSRDAPRITSTGGDTHGRVRTSEQKSKYVGRHQSRSSLRCHVSGARSTRTCATPQQRRFKVLSDGLASPLPFEQAVVSRTAFRAILVRYLTLPPTGGGEALHGIALERQEGDVARPMIDLASIRSGTL